MAAEPHVEAGHGYEHEQRDLRGGPEDVLVAAAREVPAADTEDDRRAGGQAGKIVWPKAQSAQSLETSFHTLVSWASPFTIL